MDFVTGKLRGVEGGPKLIVRINKTTSKMFYGATVGASAANERKSHAKNLVLKNFFFMAALLKHKLELGDGDPRPLLRFFFLTLISLIFQDSTMGFVCTVFLHLIICWRINYDKELDIYI